MELSGQYAGDGSMRPSTSPYALPIVMIKKKDDSNRVYADFRKLNKITEIDQEPMTMAGSQSILGLLRYSRGHILAFAEISAILSNLFKKGKSEPVQRNETQDRAYSLLNEYLLLEPVLKLLDHWALANRKTLSM